MTTFFMMDLNRGRGKEGGRHVVSKGEMDEREQRFVSNPWQETGTGGFLGSRHKFQKFWLGSEYCVVGCGSSCSMAMDDVCRATITICADFMEDRHRANSTTEDDRR